MRQKNKGILRAIEMNNYDEYQLMIRYQIGYRAFTLIIILMFANLFINTQYVWASNFIQTEVLILVPVAYFCTMTVFKGAYIS